MLRLNLQQYRPKKSYAVGASYWNHGKKGQSVNGIKFIQDDKTQITRSYLM